jgi:DNA polymerase-3 subunit gamma/tau
MIVKRGKPGDDLNKAYRPCRIDEVIGHETAKKMFKNALEKGSLPHALLFVGPSGCGKTTFARLLGMGLNCVNGPTGNPCCECQACQSTLRQSSFAVMEVDAGRTGDVATTRLILDDLPSAPLSGERYRIVIFDEAHLLGGSSKSEEALLKFLEDAPAHVYIILCTNEPQKLKEVTRNRCKIMQFNRLLNTDIMRLLEEVCQFEGFDYKVPVLEEIVKEAKGVPRAALSFLQQVASEGSWTKESASVMLNMGSDADHKAVLDLCRTIMKTKSFKDSMQIFDKIDGVPLEIIRMGLCGYFIGCLKNSPTLLEANKFSEIVELLENPYFSNPKPEHKFVNSLYKITKILRS